MPTDLSEKAFEAHIAHVLRNVNGFQMRESAEYDRARCLLPDDVTEFLRATQPDKWQRLKELYGAEAQSRFMRRLANEIDRRGSLDVLRKGIKDAGETFDLVYFQPATSMNPDYQRLYQGNVFALVRQLAYADDSSRTLDMALFLNGLPIFTAELKSTFMRQNVRHAMAQYKRDRDPKAALFLAGRCLGHFAVDPDEVYVTTRLQGADTVFLPFNKGRSRGAGNPPVHDNYDTHYLWEDIWTKDSLLNLLSQFLRESDSKAGKRRAPDIIFPRYHQLDAVRRLIADAREKGAGQRYLIQHSAGSGKSYSIAWLAHQLASLHDADDNIVFHSVVVITDRRILDRQLQATIRQFEQIRGLVENIDKTSRQLQDALEAGKRIIVATLQKFPMIVEKIGDLPGSRFAVIVDEAHSSQSGESTQSMRAALGIKQMDAAEDDPDPPTWEDKIVESMRARRHQKNISMFAFTATPKNKTLELFGEKRDDGASGAFSLYSMRQAIEEGFILDVLRHYITYRAYWQLRKTISDDPKYQSRAAKSLLRRHVEEQPETIAKKVEVIVDHFHEHVAPQIKNQARAMIVARSRIAALRYYRELKRCLAEKNYPYAALVAFSGSLEDDGRAVTEAGENGFSEAQTAERFMQGQNRFLVVAEKFQTGFDAPLLMAMYVDKKLAGVHAVQTLSRLNRIHPRKDSTVVLDFVNRAEHIQAAFQPYFEASLLSESADHNLLYDHERKLRDFHFFSDDEVDAFVKALYENTDQPRLQSLLRPALDRMSLADQDERAEFHSRLDSFLRCYAFLAQVIPFEDASLEKLYQFSRYLWRLSSQASAADALPLEALQNVDIAAYGVHRSSDGALTPEPRLHALEPLLETDPLGDAEDPLEPLSEIIQFLNEFFGENADAAWDTLNEVKDEVARDEAVRSAVQINPRDKAKLTIDAAASASVTRRHKVSFEFFKEFSDNTFVRDYLLDWINDEVVKRIGGQD